MIWTRVMFTLIAAVACSTCASAQRVVNEWGGANSLSWAYDTVDNKIEITAADSNTFSFETYDLSTGAPLDLDLITVVGAVSGTVRVRVGPDPGSARIYGATDVEGINLTNATTGELAGLKIRNDLGELTGVSVDNVTGTIEVGDAANSIRGDLFNTFSADSVTGAMTITGILASGSSIDVGTLGNLTLGQEAPIAGHEGNIGN